MEFGKAGHLAKARSRPDKVRQVLEKTAGQDGLLLLLFGMNTKLFDRQFNKGARNEKTAHIIQIRDTKFSIMKR